MKQQKGKYFMLLKTQTCTSGIKILKNNIAYAKAVKIYVILDTNRDANLQSVS